MNKALIIPVAALITNLLKQFFHIEIAAEDMETTLNVLLVLISGLGIFMNPKKGV